MRYHVREINGVMSTDDIIPGRYKHMYTDVNVLGKHVFEERIPGFAASLNEGDALWATDMFGIGSSREQAATSLLAAGVGLVIAPSFGRIFYRNAWNVGLRLITAVRPFELKLDRTFIQVDFENGLFDSELGRIQFQKPPNRLEEIVLAGGLLNWVKKKSLESEASS